MKIQFWAIFPHLCLLKGNPLTPPLLLLTEMLSLGAAAVTATERKLLQVITIPSSPHLPENSIFGHFALFVLAHGQPLDPTSAFTDKEVIT